MARKQEDTKKIKEVCEEVYGMEVKASDTRIVWWGKYTQMKALPHKEPVTHDLINNQKELQELVTRTKN